MPCSSRTSAGRSGKLLQAATDGPRAAVGRLALLLPESMFVLGCGPLPVLLLLLYITVTGLSECMLLAPALLWPPSVLFVELACTAAAVALGTAAAAAVQLRHAQEGLVLLQVAAITTRCSSGHAAAAATPVCCCCSTSAHAVRWAGAVSCLCWQLRPVRRCLCCVSCGRWPVVGVLAGRRLVPLGRGGGGSGVGGRAPAACMGAATVSAQQCVSACMRRADCVCPAAVLSSSSVSKGLQDCA